MTDGPRSSPEPERPERRRRPGRRELGQALRLYRLAAPHRGRLVGAFLAVAAGSLLTLAPWRAIRFLVDAIVPGGDPEILGAVALVLLAIFAGSAIARAFSSYLLSYVGEAVVLDLRTHLYRHLQDLSLSFYSERRTGELVSRLTNDVTTVRGLVTSDIASGLSQILVFVGAIALIMTSDLRLTLFMLAMIPLVAIAAFVTGRTLRKLSTEVQDVLAEATTVIEESISGVRVVQSFGRETYEVGRFQHAVTRAFEVAMGRARVIARFGPAVSFLFGTATTAILWLGGREVLAGRLSPGQLVEFIGLAMVVTGSVAQLSSLYTRVQQALGASQRLFELLDTEPAITDPPGAIVLPRLTGQITFEGVGFRYAAQAEARPALVGIDLEIAPGEILALVGPSGAGKSTLVDLVPRFFDPTAGRVLVDGIDLKAVSLASLRRQVGLVPQETYLFGSTVRENLLYGKLDASEDEMIAAARAANAHGFITALPEGYATLVGERGVKLSGGERQRLAIARAILKDPRILLLDEATSSLDTASEVLIREALQHLMEGRTSIVIAHRLSTVRHAHRIAVLDRGRLVELGSHDELLAAAGLYARLYDLQFLEETTSD